MLSRRLSHLSVLLIAAMGLAIGLAAPSAAHEVSHLINGSSIKPRSISGNRLKNNTLTGKQINESTLGTVPRAKTATTALTAKGLPALVLHPLDLSPNWTSVYPDRPASYAIDAQGVVHLQGAISCSSSCGDSAFVLPQAAAPGDILDELIYGYHGAIGVLYIDATGTADIAVATGNDISTVDELSSLEGITYTHG